MTQISFNGPDGMDGQWHNSLKNCQNHCGTMGGLKSIRETKRPGFVIFQEQKGSTASAMCPLSSWNKWVVYWQEPPNLACSGSFYFRPRTWEPGRDGGHIQCEDKSIWQGINSSSTGVISSLASVREWMVVMNIYICDPDHQISSHDLFPVCGPKELCLWPAYLSSDKTSILSH